NVVFRRIVKSFDDDVTTPDIRRFYDWNMQFNPKPEIKGDYGVDARGSSVLLVREMQAQNLFLIALHLGAHPVYGPMLRNRDLLRKLFQAHMIPADEVVLSDDEIDAILANAAVQNGEDEAAKAKAQIEAEKIEQENRKLDMQAQIANMEASTKIEVARLNHETQMMKLAETLNVTLEKIEADLRKSREANASKERIAAAEFAVTSVVGPGGGGYV